MPANYACLDTNILFRFVTQGQPGCEIAHWDELKQAIGDGSVTLLVPEVTSLEFENKVRRLKENLDGKIGAAQEKLRAATKDIWNEIGDLSAYLDEQVGDWKRRKVAEAETRRDQVHELLASANVVRLPFDHEIMCRTRRRMLAGRLKVSKERADADAFIIDSLLRFFEGREHTQLLFCTENSKEFDLETTIGQKVLHPLLQEGLPPTQLFTDLGALMRFVKERKAVERPTEDEVEEALEREKVEEASQRMIEAITAEQSLATEAMVPIDLTRLAIRGALPSIDPEKLAKEFANSMAFPRIDPEKLLLGQGFRQQQEAIAKVAERFRQQQEAIAKMTEPFRQQQEAMAKMMEPFCRQQEVMAKVAERFRQDQEAMAKMMEPFRQQIEAVSNAMASLSERIGPAHRVPSETPVRRSTAEPKVTNVGPIEPAGGS